MTSKHQEVAETLRKAIKGGLNVLLQGSHGTGKTSLITGVASELGLSLKYYSTSTLDPFVDLVGLPVPRTDEEGRPCVVYHRPKDIDQANIVFFDELNRAQPKVLNAVLEVIQFHTINGEPLPNLKCVLAACNPDTGDYSVSTLDAALLDRFHIHMIFEPGPDPEWFRKQFGKDLGSSLCDWYYTDLDNALQHMISPRKLEHIGQLLRNGIDPAQAMGHDSKLPFRLLKQRIHAVSGILQVEDFLASPELYAKKVGADMNIAFRFFELLLRMKPEQMADVRKIIIALPRELLVRIRAECPFILKKLVEATRKKYAGEEAEFIQSIIDDELREYDKQCAANSKGTKAA